MKVSAIFLGVLVATALGRTIHQRAEEEYGDFFEGDILLTPEQEAAADSRNAVLNSKRWPDGIVPYYLHRSVFPQKDIDMIEGAIDEYNSKTCLKLVLRTTQRSYVNITRFGSGCYSYVGVVTSIIPGQVLHLSTGCMRIGTVLHELMHAVGFWHEQSRMDRDDYVTIEWDNIYEQNKHNFNKKTVSNSQLVDSPYNYESVMHYSSMAFSKNGKPTIVVKKTGQDIGQRNGFHYIDLWKINRLYGCTNIIGTSTFPPEYFTTPGGGPAPPTTVTLPFSCNFNTMCGFLHDPTGVTQWRRGSGETSSPLTGPESAYSGYYYLYLEASGLSPGDDAHVVSPVFDVVGDYCIKFAYHMYAGSSTDMGTLKVTKKGASGTEVVVFNRSGDLGDQWNIARLQLTGDGKTQLTFSAYRGGGFQSDMAIDDVRIEKGSCSA